MEVCSTMQKLLDYDNFKRGTKYKDGIDQNRLRTWNDDVLARTDETIQKMIKSDKNMVSHLTKCKHKGCMELKKNWGKDGMRIKKCREDYLRADQNQELSDEVYETVTQNGSTKT